MAHIGQNGLFGRASPTNRCQFTGNRECGSNMATTLSWQYSSAMCLGCGNGWKHNIIYTFLRSRRLRIPSNIFYVNLAIADIGFNIFVGFLRISMLVHEGAKPFGDTACFIQAVCVCLVATASFDCICGVTISRYIIIVHPSKKKYLKWRFCIGVCLLCWIPPILLMIPNFTGWSRFAWLPRQYHCAFDWGYNLAHSALIFIFNFGAASIIMCFFYIRIYMAYRKSKKRMTGHWHRPKGGIRNVEIRLALQLFVVYALYNIFWMPIFIFAVFADSKGTGPTWLYMTVIILCTCNSSVNVFVTCIITRYSGWNV